MLAEDIRQHSEIWDHVYIPARWEISTKPHWPTARHDFLLYILVAFASNSFMKAFFRENALKPKEGTNPLVYAAHFHKDEHARTLLLRGARLHHRGWETRGFRQSLPIEVAFQNRHYAMITHFVEAGSTVPPHIFTDSFFERQDGMTSCDPMIPSSIARVLVQTDDFAENFDDCLNEATWHEMKTSDQLLVFADATEEDLIAITRRFIQVADEHFTPNLMKEAFFHFAVAQGYFSAARYLFALGTPLPSDLLVRLHHHPSRWKTAPMVRFLVDNGADALVHTSRGDSVLHAILSASGSNLYDGVDDADEDAILGAVEFLVGYGCDPLEADSGGNTPLDIAVEQGYISVARYLLTFGALLPPDLLVTVKRDEYHTAPMIHFLVENGVNVLARASNEGSALHIALWRLHDDNEALEIVKLLIGYGCNPLQADSRVRCAISSYPWRSSASRFIHVDELSGQGTHDPLPRRKRGRCSCTCRRGDSVLHSALHPFGSDDAALKTMKFLVGYGCNPFEANCRGNTPLYIAVERGHISTARYLLTLGALLPSDLLVTVDWSHRNSTPGMIRFLVENGVDVLARSSRDGSSPLHVILLEFYGDDVVVEVVKLLVGYGCNPFEADFHGITPLHVAVERGHLSAAQYLLTLGVPLPPDLLVTLGYYAGDVQMTSFLVENGVDVLAHTSDGDSVLHIVLRFSFGDEALKTVKLLVGYGCNPFEANCRGNTPLHIAVKRSHISTARYLLTLGALLPPDLLVTLDWSDGNLKPGMIRFLVDNGVDVLACTSYGDSVLHITLQHFYDDNEALETVTLLVGYGCDPLGVGSCGNTPLQIAVERGHISVARYLLTLGAHLPPDLLVTLKRYQWRRCTVPMIHFLIENGANAPAHTSDGDSMLHIGLRYFDHDEEALDAVKLLVGYGCNPLEANSRGKTPLHVAVDEGHLSVARYLLSLGALLPPDILVTRTGYWSSTTRTIRFLVENGVDVLARARNGDSVLHITLRCFIRDFDELDAVKLLVGYGCDPLETNSRGETPLHIAVHLGHMKTIKYLLSLNIPLPWDILFTAIRGGHNSAYCRYIVANLVTSGCDTSDGDTLLQVAIMSGKVDVVEYLLLTVTSMHHPPLEDLLSTAELAPPFAQSGMRHMLSDCLTMSESPDFPPARRARRSVTSSGESTFTLFSVAWTDSRQYER